MKNIYKLAIIILLIASSNETLYSQYSLWTWGSNRDGQLGNDRAEHEPLPVLVNDDGDWEKVYPFYAIKKDGSLWTWGRYTDNRINDTGGLAIRLFDDSKWKEIIRINSWFVFGIKQDGSLWSWGYWNLGWNISKYSEKTEENNFTGRPILLDSTHKWDYFSYDAGLCLAIDENRRLYTWGRFDSQMGIGQREETEIDSITQVGISANWKKVVINSNDNCIGLKNDGTLWIWGKDIGNLLGDWNNIYYEPIKLGYTNCRDFVLNNLGLIVLSGDGKISSIGEYFNSSTKLVEKHSYDNHKFGKNYNLSFSLFRGNSLYLWGINQGLKFTKRVPEGNYFFPTKIDISNGKVPEGILDLAQIGNGFIFVDSNHNLKVWGDNYNGRLANGKTSFYYEPINPLPNKFFKDVSSGIRHSVAIDEYGMMWVWGYNNENQLGITGKSTVHKPVPINYNHDWVKVFSFLNSNFAIKTDGTLWAWGNNRSGKLGVGHNNQVLEPTKVEEYGHWKKVHSSTHHSIALKEDGTLWTWGVGINELGLGVDTVLTPKKIGTDTDWIDIACGDKFSVAIKSDYTYWCWGTNNYGTFGDSINRTYDKPTKVHLNTIGKVTKVAGGHNSVILVTEQEDLYLFTSSFIGDIGLSQGENTYRSIHSNYRGYNSVISGQNELLVSSSSAEDIPSITGIKSIILNKTFEGNDWLKATVGDAHVVALRGEYITNIREPRKLVNANIYPNPSASNINIDFETFYSNINVSIYDVYGKLVLEDRSSNTDRISINHNLPHGTYILQCRDENSLIVDQVLVVE